MFILKFLLIGAFVLRHGHAQNRRVGKLKEVFAWTQLTYNINGNLILQDRFGGDDLEDEETRRKRQSDNVFFNNNDESEDSGRWLSLSIKNTTQRPTPTTSTSNNNDTGRFFIQYNNLPMGVERHGNRLFVTVPRRRYGIPSTLNYLDLNLDSNTRSPGLRPYPNLQQSRQLTSVYRTRIDSCDRLWMVDTGLLEIPDNFQQVQRPAIVVYDLNTNKLILRHVINEAELPQGLASITVDIQNGDCQNAFAYIPDLASYAIIIFSLKARETWRVTHNYFHFNPVYGNLNVAGQRFLWNDGIFSITLSAPNDNGCKIAYFHPMASNQEFSVPTCVLKNRTASQASNYWENYSVVGERGESSQSTMHGYHAGSRVIFFADIGRNAVSCWSTATALTPSNVAIVGQDSQRLSYPADLHVTGDEVWVLANTLPRFIYSTFNTNQYNFFIYKASVRELITGTICENKNGNYNYS